MGIRNLPTGATWLLALVSVLFPPGSWLAGLWLLASGFFLLAFPALAWLGLPGCVDI